MVRQVRLLMMPPVLMLCLASPPALAGEGARGPGSLSLTASIGQTTVDIMSEGDIRPNPRPFGLAGLEARYAASRTLALAWSGRLGGSFFDFNGLGLFGSGNVEDVLWSTRVGVDWLELRDHGGELFAGLGYEYGEARSWLKTTMSSEDGPRNVLTGASVRAGVALAVTSRLAAIGELDAGLYHGRADIGSLESHYNWLGRSLGVSLGLRYVARR